MSYSPPPDEDLIPAIEGKDAFLYTAHTAYFVYGVQHTIKLCCQNSWGAWREKRGTRDFQVTSGRSRKKIKNKKSEPELGCRISGNFRNEGEFPKWAIFFRNFRNRHFLRKIGETEQEKWFLTNFLSWERFFFKSICVNFPFLMKYFCFRKIA